jgi:hypothetical protein
MSLVKIPRKKMLEIFFMLIFSGVYFVVYPKWEGLTLFLFGFIWNWAASIPLDPLFENRRYRFSMLKTVHNFQSFILRPVREAAQIVKSIVAILPAGCFWWFVIYINESDMPWWSTFIGSLFHETLQYLINLPRSQ